jgi:hypothetical protein
MNTENNDSAEIVHETTITVFTWLAWIFVVLGFIAIIPGWHYFHLEKPDATGSQLANLSSLGSWSSLQAQATHTVEMAGIVLERKQE